MDEFEKLEKELAKIYGTYVEKFRNVEASPLPLLPLPPGSGFRSRAHPGSTWSIS